MSMHAETETLPVPTDESAWRALIGRASLRSTGVLIPLILLFVTSLATLGIATGLASQMTNGESIYNFPNAYQAIGQGKVLGISAPVLIAGGLLIVLHVMLKRTRVGLNIHAVGGNRHAAAMVG